MSMVVRYVEAEHRVTLDAWCRAHGMNVYPPHWLPEVGYVVPGVAAAFLYTPTSGGVAFLENVISSPESTKEQRRDALGAISNASEAEAKALGFKYIVGLTAIRSLADTSAANGYTVSEPRYSTLVKVVK